MHEVSVGSKHAGSSAIYLVGLLHPWQRIVLQSKTIDHAKGRILRLLNYWVIQKLPQIYAANQATYPIQIRKITIQICGNFWVSQ